MKKTDKEYIKGLIGNTKMLLDEVKRAYESEEIDEKEARNRNRNLNDELWDLESKLKKLEKSELLNEAATINIDIDNGKYLSDTEVLTTLLGLLRSDDKVNILLNANTGLGKTTIINDLLKILNNLEENINLETCPIKKKRKLDLMNPEDVADGREHRFIIGMPTNISVDSHYIESMKHIESTEIFSKKRVTKADGKNTLPAHTKDLGESNRTLPILMVSTHNQLANLSVDNLDKISENTILVIDEVHMMASEDYTLKNFKAIYDILKNSFFKKIICLTGTPRCLDFITNKIPFTHKINIIETEPKTVYTVNRYKFKGRKIFNGSKSTYKYPKNYMDHCFRTIIDNHEKGTISGVFMNCEKPKGYAFLQLAKEQHGLNGIYLNADEKDSIHFLELIKTNKVPLDNNGQPYDIILFNNVAKSSFSIKNDVTNTDRQVTKIYYFANLDVRTKLTTTDIKQSAARFRAISGGKIDLYLFEKVENEHNLEKAKGVYRNNALIECERRNKKDSVLTLKGEIDKSFGISYIDGVWQLNEILITHGEFLNSNFINLDLSKEFSNEEIIEGFTEVIYYDNPLKTFIDTTIEKQTRELRSQLAEIFNEVFKIYFSFFKRWINTEKTKENMNILLDDMRNDMIHLSTHEIPLSKIKTYIQIFKKYVLRNIKKIDIYFEDKTDEQLLYILRVLVIPKFRLEQSYKICARSLGGLDMTETWLKWADKYPTGKIVTRSKDMDLKMWENQKKYIKYLRTFTVNGDSITITGKTEREHECLNRTKDIHELKKFLLNTNVIKKKDLSQLDKIIDENYNPELAEIVGSLSPFTTDEEKEAAKKAGY